MSRKNEPITVPANYRELPIHPRWYDLEWFAWVKTQERSG